MIFEITPSAIDKRYGRKLNEHIRYFPDDSWIIVRDDDSMYLQKDRQQIIEQAIKDYPDTDLFTCATNRVYKGAMFDETDMLKHYVRANAMEIGYTRIGLPVPAFWWMFPKRIWNARPFDDKPIFSGGKSFDLRWVKSSWNKIRIEGLYVFHYYRLNTLASDHSHLL